MATLAQALKTILAVLAVNAVFYGFYKIAASQLQLSKGVFAIGCVVLTLAVVAVSRRIKVHRVASIE